jgi:hypothetical protein
VIQYIIWVIAILKGFTLDMIFSDISASYSFDPLLFAQEIFTIKIGINCHLLWNVKKFSPSGVQAHFA